MISERPLVSVVIPNYNYGEFVGSAVRSALAQTYSNLEVIVVDNFSTDNSLQVLSGIQDPRLRVFQFNNRGIIAAGRNFGAKQASGEVLAFLDSDDLWLPNKLELQVPHLSGEIRCVASDFIPIGDTGYGAKLIRFPEHEQYRDVSYHQLAEANFMAASSVLMARSTFADLGGFDESENLCFVEDWDLWLRAIGNQKGRILRQPLLYYRIAINKGRDLREASRRALGVLEKHSKLGLLDVKHKRTAFANCYVAMGRACLAANDPKGMLFFSYAILHSGTLRRRMRSAAGIALFLLPRNLRERVLRAYYGRSAERFSDRSFVPELPRT